MISLVAFMGKEKVAWANTSDAQYETETWEPFSQKILPREKWLPPVCCNGRELQAGSKANRKCNEKSGIRVPRKVRQSCLSNPLFCPSELRCEALLLFPLLFPLFLHLALLFPRLHGQGAWLHDTRIVFAGIEAEVRFEAPPGLAAPERLLAMAFEEFSLVARVANAYDPASEVGKLNGAKKYGPVAVSADLFDLLTLAKWAYGLTGQAFDPTIWPLKRLWAEAAQKGQPPDQREISAALALVGMDKVHLDPDKRSVVFDRPDIAFDFGGIAKGWAVDRAARLLEAAGVRNYLVRCGGEIAFLGHSPNGQPWSIGIKNPLAFDEMLGVVRGPERLSVSTSGPTEQPVKIGDRFFHHILDPRTGHPAPLSVLSITVVAHSKEPSAARTDALSTALSVLGPKQGLELLESISGFDALFLVAEKGRVRIETTPGFRALFSPVTP